MSETPNDKPPEPSHAPFERQTINGIQDVTSASTNGASHPQTVLWWNRTGLIAIVTALVAAVAPVTTGTRGFFELRVQQEKNRFDMRDKYLDRAIDTKLGPEERERLFEFLAVVFKDDPLREWAQEQLNDATAELKNQLKTTSEEKAKVEKALELEHEQGEILELNVTKLEKEKDALQRRISTLQADVDAARRFQQEAEFEKPAEFGPISGSLEEIFVRSQDAMVRVQTKSGLLSGFFVSREGYVVTAAHGISDLEFGGVTVTTNDQQSFAATVVAHNRELDVAVLKVDFVPTVQLEISSVQTVVGAEVIAIGFLEGRQLVASGGSVTTVIRDVIRYTRENSVRMLGTAGGPLIDASGHVVGLHHGAWLQDGSWRAEAIRAARIQELLILAKANNTIRPTQ